MVWFDKAGNATQAAMAAYVDDEKDREDTWTPGPFETTADIEADGWQKIGRQLSLFD
jgi:hypothetical protein